MSAASCSGPQQLAAQEFLLKFRGLWDLVGDDFVSSAQLRQLLVQVSAPAAFPSRCHFFNIWCMRCRRSICPPSTQRLL